MSTTVEEESETSPGAAAATVSPLQPALSKQPLVTTPLTKPQPRVIVLLEAACLELIQKKNKVNQLLNNVEHRGYLLKQKRALEDVRPDIVHQCLMALLDSPLNKAGLLSVYIRTNSNQCIYVSPQLSVPRTWKQFNDMMVTFLLKHKIKASEKNVPLLKLIKNDMPSTLPSGGRKIGLSVSGKQADLKSYVASHTADASAVTYVIGAVAHSDPAPKVDFVEECICISKFSLTAAVSCLTVPGVKYDQVPYTKRPTSFMRVSLDADVLFVFNIWTPSIYCAALGLLQ